MRLEQTWQDSLLDPAHKNANAGLIAMFWHARRDLTRVRGVYR